MYSLEGQIRHKAEFIKKFVPKEVKIHLIAHSIGCFISLDLLREHDIEKRIKQCYLLFPTIERMLDSSNGFWFYKIFNKIFFMLRFIYYAFSFLPLTLRTIILYIFCYFSGYPEYFLGTVIKASTPAVIDKIWFLACDEMKNVRLIDEETIKKNMKRLKFYYGQNDGWVNNFKIVRCFFCGNFGFIYRYRRPSTFN
jgi:pimeloyl-ACP methyl ester carboxylesterase